MKILTISGSSRSDSSNSRLLDHLSDLGFDHNYERTNLHFELPLFQAELDSSPLPDSVINWRNKLLTADAVIICIPEYIHNLPAVIKNALEWIASSGELVGKRVISITFTPHEPRGERAMQSLVWSLQALDANIIVELPLFKSQITYVPEIRGEGAELLKEAINLLS
ncbi:MAG: chromate reductase [Saprospiraceae bacterium]|jgi:chromate reductase